MTDRTPPNRPEGHDAASDLRARLDRIESLLGHVMLDELPPKWAEKVERAYVESRHDWAEDDPLRVAMLAHLPSETPNNVRSIHA